MLATGQSPSLIVQEKGLAQVKDTGEIEAAFEEILRGNPSQPLATEGGQRAEAKGRHFFISLQIPSSNCVEVLYPGFTYFLRMLPVELVDMLKSAYFR